MTVSSGQQVFMEYTLRLEDKRVADSNVGGKPLAFVQGRHEIVLGLEREMEGMKVGETKEVIVRPEDGYGAFDPKDFLEVDKAEVPRDALHVGAELTARDSMGRNLRARVTEVKDKTVLLDFNHPLAGKTLYFEVKVLDIKKPPVQ